MLAIVALAPTSNAQTLKPLTAFKEELKKAGEVYNPASRVAALMHAGAFENGFIAVSPTFEVRAPAVSTICIEYISRNGLYLGSQSFRSDTAGWSTVPYPSKLKDVLMSYGAKALAVHAWSASSCSQAVPDTAKTTLPVRSLLKPGSETTSYTLLIRSDGKPATIVTRIDGTQKPIRSTCTEISRFNSVRFDKQCTLDAAVFQNGARSQLVIVDTDGLKPESLVLGF
ncbi:MAG: hypothetical protein EON93_03055 [Burkholderiales bacterium]|nr:MAG: hypothetical protein EON93_03055 [Burkholderiales bacterium]